MQSRKKLDLILRFEILAFAAAALIHGGALIHGYEHDAARIAEAVIAVVLLVTLLMAGWRPVIARRVIVIGQSFALLGTLVGVFTIAIGVGPRTMPDVAYHIVILGVLAWGLWLALHWGRDAPRS